MSYAIMRMNKMGRGDLSFTENHNERKSSEHSNEDIDKNKSHLNYQIIKCDNYKEAVFNRIEEGYKKEKSIRKDAVVATEFLFTSDKEFFENLKPEETKKYFEISLDFLKKEFGEKNIISATVHLDETSPHMHSIIVPITTDGSLSMKKFLDGKKDLSKFQDKFFDAVSKEFPQLERGKSKTVTGATHKKIEELKKETNFLGSQLEQEKEKNNLTKKDFLSLKETKKEVKLVFDTYKNNVTWLNKDEIKIKKNDFEKISNIAKKNISNILLLQESRDVKKENEKLINKITKLEKENSILTNSVNKISKELNKVTLFLKNKELINTYESYKTELSWNVAKKFSTVRDKFLSDLARKKDLNDFEKNLLKTNTVKNKDRGFER